MEYKALRALRGLRARLVQMVLRDPLVPKDPLVSKDPQGLLAQMVLPGRWVLKVLVVLQD